MNGQRRRDTLQRLRVHWLRPRSSVPLALLRIVVGALILISPEPYLARRLALEDPALLIAPQGLQWLPPVLVALGPFLGTIHTLLNIAAGLCIVGLHTRWSLSVASIGFVLLFGGAQLTGTVTHNMHLLWMLLLLLVAPSGQILSLDAWRKRTPLVRAPPSSEAGVAIVTARLLLGCVYLFPGIAKLQVSGLSWALSDNLTNQMRLKWYMAGNVPQPRIDHWPTLVQLGAFGVLVFELSFIVLVCFRHGRTLAALSGLTFHAATQHFMGIPFASLWACYVVLWDGPSSKAMASPSPAAAAFSIGPSNDRPLSPERRSPPWRVELLGASLLAAVVVQGVRRQTEAWPFACYPTFAHHAPRVLSDLGVDVRRADGSWVTLRPAARRASQEWGRVWRIMGLYDGRVDRRALAAYAVQLTEQHGIALDGSGARGRDLGRVRYFVETYSIAPENYGNGPLARRLIGEQ